LTRSVPPRDAEDVLQETLAAAWCSYQRGLRWKGASAGPWLWRIARYKVAEYYERRSPTPPAGGEASDTVDGRGLLGAEEDKHCAETLIWLDVEKAIKRMPQPHRSRFKWISQVVRSVNDHHDLSRRTIVEELIRRGFIITEDQVRQTLDMAREIFCELGIKP